MYEKKRKKNGRINHTNERNKILTLLIELAYRETLIIYD